MTLRLEQTALSESGLEDKTGTMTATYRYVDSDMSSYSIEAMRIKTSVLTT